ncbi:MAG: S1 RNA-binding domain-containing protein [Lactovum sp.]
MKNNLGKIIAAIITDENENFYFVQKSGETYAILKSEGERQIGELVKGFVYEDRSGKLRLTCQPVTVTTESYGWGCVVDVRRDLGVFLDIGLTDKDIVVSLDDLPEDKNQWPKKNDQLYIKLILDQKNRLWGHLAWAEDFQVLAGRAYDNMMNQKLTAIVYRNKESGTFVYLPVQNMLGFIHPTEQFVIPRIGEKLETRVIGFNARNKTLNLSCKPRSFEMLDADAQMILTYLENAGGRMFYHDKSDPADIKSTFGISKGQFKKALGSLMKAKKIRQTQDSTELIKEEGK